MSIPDLPRPLIVILGPTAVGKTGFSLDLAERLGAEIVSADSRYLYRGMNIGTAKPTPEELQRVPHHLIDVADPDETWSLAVFKQSAQEAIASIHRRGRAAILVGGTGQYVRAILEDWEIPEQQPDPALRTLLEAWGEQIGKQALHAKLAILDPQAASQIQYQNLRRTVRALEVIFHTGKRFSAQRSQGSSPYSRFLFGLKRPRPELYERIDRRIETMLEEGLVGEVEQLLLRGYSPDLPSMSAIGYREIASFLRAEMTLAEAVVQMKRLTRQFVRRQANWFKESDPAIHWYDAGQISFNQVQNDLADVDNWILPG